MKKICSLDFFGTALMLGIWILITLSSCDREELGSDTYTCNCDCVAVGFGRAYIDIITCADNDVQAEENCRVACERECVAIGGDDGSPIGLIPGAENYCSLTDALGVRRDPLVAAQSPNAIFVGYADVDNSQIHLTNLSNGDEAISNISGELSFYGGDCPNESCEIRLEYASLNAVPFNLGSNRIEDLSVLNNGVWNGSKDEEGNFTFDGDASIIIGGLIDGDYTSLTVDVNEIGIKGELKGMEILEISRESKWLFNPDRDVHRFEDRIIYSYPEFFFEGTFKRGDIQVELKVAIILNDGAPYAKAEHYYSPEGQLLLDGTKSSLYKCQWGYCETRPGISEITIPGLVNSDERIIEVTDRMDGLEVYWMDAESRLLGRDIIAELEETPSYPVTLYVFTGSDENRRFDTDILDTPLSRSFVISPLIMLLVTFVILIITIVLYFRFAKGRKGQKIEK